MKLHRPAVRPDWEYVPAVAQNAWQRLASHTHGVVTPGNMVSLAGLVLVAGGLMLLADGRLLSGLVLLGTGRLFDGLDGWAADRTSTKSQLGEAVDATFDKLGALGALVVLTAHGQLPWLATLLIALQNGTNTVVALYAKLRRYALHPVKNGKLSTAIEWNALGLYVLAAIVREHSAAGGRAVFALASLTLAVALAYGVPATGQYLRELYGFGRKGITQRPGE